MTEVHNKIVRESVMKIASHYRKEGKSKKDSLKLAWDSAWKVRKHK